MLPPAPGRLSTTTDWPSDSVICCAITRATISVPPPGANGMIRRTGRAGYCCAKTLPAPGSALRSSTHEAIANFIDFLHRGFCSRPDTRKALAQAGVAGMPAGLIIVGGDHFVQALISSAPGIVCHNLAAAGGTDGALWHTSAQSRRAIIDNHKEPQNDRPDILFTSCGITAAVPARASAGGQRRQVVVKGRRVKTVDVHAHCVIPEAIALTNAYVTEVHRPGMVVSLDRIREMDAQGIDVEALSINPFWYREERDAAAEIVRIQNEKLAELCAAYPERFVAFASLALQFPD